MEQVGVVTRIEDQYAELEVQRMSACGESCNGCSASCDIGPHTVKVVNTLNAKVGEQVQLKSESTVVLKYILLLYGVPMVFLVLGIFIGASILKGMNITQYEMLSLLIGLVGMGIGLLLVKSADQKYATKNEDLIEVVKILSDMA